LTTKPINLSVVRAYTIRTPLTLYWKTTVNRSVLYAITGQYSSIICYRMMMVLDLL